MNVSVDASVGASVGAPVDAGPGRRAAGLLRAPVAGATWRAVAHCLLSVLLAVPGVLTVLLLLVGVVLSVTLLGLPVVALALTAARGLGRTHRALARRLLGADVDEPERRRRGRSALDFAVAVLSDVTAWRTLGYLLVQVPAAAAGLYAPVLLVGVALELVHSVVAADPHSTSGLAVLVLVIAFVGPWPVRATVALNVALARVMIGPDPSRADSERLRRSRSAVVEGSAAEVRRIERDLHDGTQARLTAIALAVDMARTDLGAGAGESRRAQELLDIAHTTTTEAITELRTLIRGIHPPALDEGLARALGTLADASPLPVRAELDLRGPALSPAIETIAYFCVSELLQNAVKHSGASVVDLTASTRHRRLRLEVRDDGRGAAAAPRGSGLTGLHARVGAVDGTLVVDSPPGRGTSARIDLPLRA